MYRLQLIFDKYNAYGSIIFLLTVCRGELTGMLNKLSEHSILHQIKEDELQLLLPHLTEYHFEPGKMILQQGESSESFHIILSGKVNVFVKK